MEPPLNADERQQNQDPSATEGTENTETSVLNYEEIEKVPQFRFHVESSSLWFSSVTSVFSVADF